MTRGVSPDAYRLLDTTLRTRSCSRCNKHVLRLASGLSSRRAIKQKSKPVYNGSTLTGAVYLCTFQCAPAARCGAAPCRDGLPGTRGKWIGGTQNQIIILKYRLTCKYASVNTIIQYQTIPYKNEDGNFPGYLGDFALQVLPGPCLGDVKYKNHPVRSWE